MTMLNEIVSKNLDVVAMTIYNDMYCLTVNPKDTWNSFLWRHYKHIANGGWCPSLMHYFHMTILLKNRNWIWKDGD